MVDAVFACSRKDRLMARSGTPYLALELRDRTRRDPGPRVQGRRRARPAASTAATSCAWPAASSASATSCSSRCATSPAPKQADPAAFLPVAYRNVDELEGFLEHLAREVHDAGYAGLLERLLADDALRAEWRRAPCTRAGHHAYLGGLLEHTVAVGTLALECAQLHPRLNPDLLLTAALVHDLGKTREFTYGAEIGLTEEGRLLGHVVLGQRILDRCSSCRTTAGSRSRTACSPTTDRRTRPAGGSARPRRWRSTASTRSTRSVKGALEHGLP